MEPDCTLTFGTDGVRGLANLEITPEAVVALGRALGRLLREAGENRPVVVGQDPRRSSAMLKCALAAGLCASGMDVLDAGVAPSPAISFLTEHLDVCAGAMVSASHNPPAYNGVKFFAQDGTKLPVTVELEIEEMLPLLPHYYWPEGTAVGQVYTLDHPLDPYLDLLCEAVGGSLRGLTIVLDAANGAASGYAADLLTRLGAKVIAESCDPTGLNINDGVGALHPEAIRAIVLSSAADVGISLDGDADRVILTDECGRIADGDDLLYVAAAYGRRHKLLNRNVVVGTILSNLGLEIALREIECELVRTLVGDRYVYERMAEMGATIGGEQCGHIIHRTFLKSGDGLLAAIRALRAMQEGKARLSELTAPVVRAPQFSATVPMERGVEWRTDALAAELEAWEEQLGDQGRIVIRESGTEPVIRLMAECIDADRAQGALTALTEMLRSQLAPQPSRKK